MADPAPVERFELTVRAEPSALALVRQALRRLGSAVGLSEDRAFALQVAVGEAMNNVVEHAYGAAGGTVCVHARRQGGAVLVDVEDHGRWRPERPEERERGRGIRLMRELADSVEIQTTPSGTTVRLTIAIAAATGGAGAPSQEIERGTSR